VPEPFYGFTRKDARRAARAIRKTEQIAQQLSKQTKRRLYRPPLRDLVPIYNASGWSIPPGGVAEITGWNSTYRAFEVDLPSGDNVKHIVISPGLIRNGQQSFAWRERVHRVLCSDYASQQFGYRVGTAENSWFAKFNPEGPLVVLGQVPASEQYYGYPPGVGLIRVAFLYPDEPVFLEAQVDMIEDSTFYEAKYLDVWGNTGDSVQVIRPYGVWIESGAVGFIGRDAFGNLMFIPMKEPVEPKTVNDLSASGDSWTWQPSYGADNVGVRVSIRGDLKWTLTFDHWGRLQNVNASPISTSTTSSTSTTTSTPPYTSTTTSTTSTSTSSTSTSSSSSSTTSSSTSTSTTTPPGGATTIFWDDFEDDTLGNAPGAPPIGDSWTVVAGTPTVESYLSSQRLRFGEPTAGATETIRGAFTATADCTYQADFVATNTNDNHFFRPGHSGFAISTIAEVRFDDDGYIYAKDGTDDVQLQTYNAGTVYTVKLVLDNTNYTYDVYINGVLKASAIDFVQNAATTDRITITGITLTDQYGYWDNVRVTYD